MSELLQEKAQELGRLLGQSDEYKAVSRAQQRLSEDRDAVAAMNRLAELEHEVATSLQSGREPSDAVKDEYEQVFSRLQASPAYQQYVAAQSNFDKKLVKVNEEISRGIESGSRSRIILPT
jgi:cell fate (sporulation/competence/biofilm development) regulator YlbF (YheA/YmcA/DUF963 family)